MKTASTRLTAILTASAALLQLSPAYAAFSDVSNSPYKSAIDALEERGVLEGYADGTFKPESTINRAEFLKIVLEARESTEFHGGNCFPDVTDQWFAKYVCNAKSEGIVGGYPDGTFKPEQPVTFVEAGKILTLAFKQQTQGGAEWYEPFARALEASKAIPTSVNALDENLTRGEMAEMMWRLRDGITDRPSKGYLNVKYPDVKVNTASDDVQIATSCADLRAFTEEAQKNQSGGVYYYGTDGAEGAPVPSTAPRGESKSANTAGDYSQTNVQVAGVDEGDVVKTDGNYIYAVSNGTVRIVKAVPATDLAETAVIGFEDENFTANDLYVDGDRLVVIGSVWSNRGGVYPMLEKPMARDMMIWPGYGTSKSEARIYDVSSRSAPKLVRKVTFDGNVVSSRRIEGRLYLVMNQYPMYWGQPVPLTRGATEEDLLPKYSDTASGTTDEPVTRCGAVSILPHVPSPQYLMIGVVPLRDTKEKVNTEVILGSAENVYASLENLYVATTEWNYVWDAANPQSTQKTNVFRFAYMPDGVGMEAQGSVQGRILNQFSMDEYENHFRIATTRDQQWRADNDTIPSENQLYVLNRDMKQVGAIEDIAPGESIYSVRFMGDRAYVVTFKQVDPLFVIDLEDPRNPEILGQLKIPGYSNYLHPYDENHVIGIGKEVDESINKEKVHGSDAVHYTAVLGLKLSLFDVSDVSRPKELHKVVIGDRGTESPVLYDHRALLFEKDRDLLALPVSVMELPAGAKPDDDSVYPTQTFQGAYAFRLTLRDGFRQLGRVTQYTDEEMQKSGNYLYGKNVERVLRIGESLYTLSPAGVQSNKLDGFARQDTVWFSGAPPVKDVVYPTR